MSGENPSPPTFVRRSPRKHALSHASEADNIVTKRARQTAVGTREGGARQSAVGTREGGALPSSSEITESPYNNPPFREIDRMTYFHSFLLTHTVKKLREMSKPFKLRTSNRSQAQLISNLVMYMHTKSFEDVSIRDCISTNEFLSGFENWEKEAKESRSTLSRLQDVSEFINMLHRTDRVPVLKAILNYQKEGQSGFPLTAEFDQPTDPFFSLNEFARLMVLLRDDEITKNALQSAYSRTLSRIELDARFTRDSFWSVIANRFNDHNVDSIEDFSGRLDEIDSNERPLCQRSPTVLKKQYENVRKTVTVVRSNWSKSGQNDPTDFVRFLRKTENGEELTADSKRAYIFIIVTKVGQENEAEDLIKMTSKLIEEDDGGIEEGFLGNEENNQAFPVSKGRSSGARSSSNAKELADLTKFVDHSNRISEEHNAILREHLTMERERSTPAGPRATAAGELRVNFGDRVGIATLLAESSKSIKVARDLNDVQLAETLEANHQELLDQFKALIGKKRSINDDI